MRAFELVFPGAARSCRVRIGRGALTALADELAGDTPGRPLVVVSDTHVRPLHGNPLAAALAARNLPVEVVSFAAGESSKTRETKAAIEDRLLELGAGRDAALVAVGGGVTADLAGFVAATWHRGIPVVHVPTSVLAMADAALGGKTAVNLPSGKNLIGCFHQPWGVYADPGVLSTLPREEYVSGLAEVVKTAVVADATLFRTLEHGAEDLLARAAAVLDPALVRCLEIKADIVQRDERDLGPRAALNFGHTIGHALETVSGYTLRHGDAVAIGMLVEARLASTVAGFAADELSRLEALLRALGLPRQLPSGVSPEAVVAATRRDKKMRLGRVRYALPAAIGHMATGMDASAAVDEAMVQRALSEASG